MGKVLDYGVEVSEFELSHYHVHFRKNTFGKSLNLLRHIYMV